MNTRVLALFVAPVAAVWASAAVGQDLPGAIIEPVAHSGDPAPGIPGFTLYSVVLSRIDGAGNVMFFAFLDGPEVEEGNGRAIFYGQPGNVQKLFWESEQAPDMPEGVVIADLLTAGENFSETGWIAFTPGLAGPGIEPGVNDRALFVGPPGDFQKVLQGGDQAPGCDPGVYIDVGYGTSFGGRLSDKGTLYVSGYLAGPGVTGANDRARWIGTRDNLELVYREGMQAPGCEPGVVFTSADSIVHNDAGQIGFRGSLIGPGVTSENDMGHWLGGPGTLTKIARMGDQVPEMADGVTWMTVAGAGAGTNSPGESGDSGGPGDVAEPGIIQGSGVTEADDYVLFLGDGDGLYLVAREGDPAPEAGPGVYFETFGGCRINNRTEVFYLVKYAGPGITDSNKWAMYFGPYGAGQLTLRDGDPAPTFPPDVTLWRVNATPSLTAMNDVGDIIAPMQIAGPGVTEDDKVVLWLRHRVLQRWVPLLRSGSSIGGRTVYAADEGDFGQGYCKKTGGADGKRQSLNDQGMLAIVLQFTDGTEGVFRISPPVFGDGDQDGDVDLADWSLMAGCLTGPDGGLPPDCSAFDLDADGDVDLVDHRLFQQLFQGS